MASATEALNRLSDRATEAVRRAEIWLQNNGVGPLPAVKGRWWMSYARSGNTMRIVVSSASSAEIRFVECNRQCKLEAIEMLPVLLESIQAYHTKLISEASKSVDAAEQYVRENCS